jgi:hypothetical protein
METDVNKQGFELNPILKELGDNRDKSYSIAFIKHLMYTGKLSATPLAEIDTSKVYSLDFKVFDPAYEGQKRLERDNALLKEEYIIHTEKKYWTPKYYYSMLLIANTIYEGELYIHLVEVYSYLIKKKNITETMLYYVGLPILISAPLIIASFFINKSQT